MPNAPDKLLLDALLDSWDRNNTILLNLLQAVPEGGLEARAMPGQPIRRATVHTYQLCSACIRLRGRP